MATCQGERYIERQLRSILSQLDPGDELCIVDDASTDRTCEVIRSLHDNRIRLILSPHNRGVLATFEASLRAASGDILFLSDQDDRWLPGKVSAVLNVFAGRPDVDLVASDANLIDENDQPLQASYYPMRGGFTSRFFPNLLRCRFLGATMAFRASLLPRVLPFPRGFDVLHDIWIGMRNTLSGGKTFFIDQPLIEYRRHTGNVSRRQNWFRRARIRLDLLLALSLYSLKR